MSVYTRTDPMAIPDPSEAGRSEDEEESFLTDPEQLRDRLPQPFRMIDKVLNRLLDVAWDTISERETARIAEKSKKKIPALELSLGTKLPGRTNCLACSEDGRYIFMGHSQGLSVSCASSLICVSAWSEDSLEITSIHVTCIAEMAYLLGTIDDMGVARVFAYHTESLHPLKVITETEDINKRIICTTFELSRGGEYGVVSISCGGANWLEVYRFPIAAWLKDLELAASQKQAENPSGVVDVKWSAVGVLLKIKPLKTLAGTTLKSPLEVLQKADQGSVIGSGQNHLISSRQWEEQDAVFRSTYRKYLGTDTVKTKEAEEIPSHCTQHLLLPCGLFPGVNGAKTQPGPIAVCVWWSGSHNLLQYSLCKLPKDKSDVESKPNVVWPNAHEILCSAVSRCTRYIALGLESALVAVWDRHLGLPLSVVSMPVADSAFSKLLFVDRRPPSAESSLLSQGPAVTKVHLLVACKSGATHALATGQGAESHYATQLLTERPEDSGGLPTAIASVPFLQGLALVVHKNGKMLLQDAIDKTIVCCLIPPATHLLANPWDPIFALDTERQTLFIRGDQQHPNRCESASGDGHSHLLVFRFAEPPAIIRPYKVCRPESLWQQRGASFATLEEACNLYLQQRALCVDERNKGQAWSQLLQSPTRTHSSMAAHPHRS